jgi:chitodextrinase
MSNIKNVIISLVFIISTFAFTVPALAQIIPANRTTLWQPGVTYNGGIPNRTTIYKTVSPRGGSLDDTANIQAALDGCPPNQVVQLTAGTFNITGNGLNFTSTDCTLRGMGPGTGATGGNLSNDANSHLVGGGTGTFLIKADRATNANFAILYVQPPNGNGGFGASINLAADAVQGTNSLTLASNPGIQVGEIVYIDENTDNDPDVFWGLAHDPPGGGSRRWFDRQDRSLDQIMEVTAVNGNTITFATPFHTTFQTAYQAQLTRYKGPLLHKVGIEDMTFMGGMGGDYHGNLSVNQCAYCWVKNIEAYWSVGTSVGFYSTYRSELRDSYIHETPDPSPGGGGYQSGLAFGSSDNLFENNIMWNGNKEIVMRATGGGNVIAYNYMDDSFGASYPELGEAGLNAGHYTTPHMELLEGNYSQNYKGDSFWGNSIDITVFRNWLSDLRAAAAPLNTYSYQGYPYGDYENRYAVDIQAHSFRQNFVGNVLGMQNQQLLSYHGGSYDIAQTGWVYENFNNFPSDTTPVMWEIGSEQDPNGWTWVANTYQTQLRQGNWDWVTRAQTWYTNPIGATGTGTGTSQTIPNSLYLTSKPAFFGSNPWPWVDPSTGATFTLPAKVRFAQLRGGSTDTTAPSTPTNLAASAISSSQINLTWTASTDNVAATGYKIFRGGVQVGTSATNSYGDTGLSPSTAYSYTVSAFDAAGNNSPASNAASATTQAGAPVPTATISANPTSITSGQSSTLTWSSTNATSCTGNGFSASGTSGSTSVSPTVTTTYSVTCTGAGGTSPAASATVTMTNSTDTTPPSVPTGLTATAVSSSGINLAWTASTDNVGVTGYKIFRGGAQVGASATNSYSDTGLTASTAYTYTVSAYDAAGNNSAQSTSTSATTQAGGGGTITMGETTPVIPTNNCCDFGLMIA